MINALYTCLLKIKDKFVFEMIQFAIFHIIFILNIYWIFYATF